MQTVKPLQSQKIDNLAQASQKRHIKSLIKLDL